MTMHYELKGRLFQGKNRRGNDFYCFWNRKRATPASF